MKETKMWDDEWTEFKGTSIFGRFLRRAQKNTLEKIFSKIGLEKSSRIVDVGCGSGTTLYFFKSFGFKNSIGIDNSTKSLSICRDIFNLEIGKDVFLLDATKTKFNSRRFKLVFSDGLLEHFKDPTPFIREMCRISSKWILIFQPDHQSLINKVKQNLSDFVIRFYRKGNIYTEAQTWKSEFDYTKDDYEAWFKKFGFKLIDHGGLNFNESMWLLFEKE